MIKSMLIIIVICFTVSVLSEIKSQAKAGVLVFDGNKMNQVVESGRLNYKDQLRESSSQVVLNADSVVLNPQITVQESLTYEHGVGNGGDAVVDEFKELCNYLADKLVPARLKQDPSLSISVISFKEVCVKTDIFSTTKELVLRGEIKDAINISSENKIIIQRYRWLSLPQQLKLRLTAHEVFGYLGTLDGDYQFTRRFFSNFNVSTNSMSSVTGSSKFGQWRVDFIESLKQLLIHGSRLTNYDDEIQLYLANLAIMLDEPLEAWKRPYITVLSGALADSHYFESSPKVRLTVLRNMISYTINDLETTTYQVSIGVGKVESILKSLRVLAVAKTESVEMEMTLLVRGAYMVLSLIDQSDGISESKKLEIKNHLTDIFYQMNKFKFEKTNDQAQVFWLREKYKSIFKILN